MEPGLGAPTSQEEETGHVGPSLSLWESLLAPSGLCLEVLTHWPRVTAPLPEHSIVF